MEIENVDKRNEDIIKADKLRELQAERNDVEKLEDLKLELIGLKTKYSFESKANKAKLERLCKFINEFVMSH